MAGRCFICMDVGHRARACSRPIICFLCEEPGHLKSRCSQRSFSCFLCGQMGHLKGQCTKFQIFSPKNSYLGACRIGTDQPRSRIQDSKPKKMIDDSAFLIHRGIYPVDGFFDPMLLDPEVEGRSKSDEDGGSGRTVSFLQVMQSPNGLFRPEPGNGEEGQITEPGNGKGVKAVSVDAEYTEGFIENLVEDIAEEPTPVQASFLEFVEQWSLTLSNIFIIDEMVPDESDFSTKKCRDLFFFAASFIITMLFRDSSTWLIS